MGVKARQELRALGMQRLLRWPMEDALHPPRDRPAPTGGRVPRLTFPAARHGSVAGASFNQSKLASSPKL